MLKSLFGLKDAGSKADRRPEEGSIALEPSPISYLSPALLALEEWKWPTPGEIRAQLLGNNCGELWRSIPNGHKWLNYFDYYESLFSSFRGKKPKVLEIGVDRGGSLVLWKRYFGIGSQIVGIDIKQDCLSFDRPSDGIHVRIGSQDDPVFLESIVDEFGPFDIVIDDGSHIVSHQIASFNALFDRGVKVGGIYMVEDLETSYWGQRTGQADLPVTFIDFARAVIDLMHKPYVDQDYGAFLIEQTSGAALEVPYITKIVDQVRFFDSIVAFYRRDRLPPVVEHLFNT
ncbi:MAG TPA: hypothetical protein VJU59_46355 [Paraburkholderia sp.]|uniref:hypothetical protein n=1 Tax=Paraburkholderia sp. TaxID=1926495 RepID=UPI002B470437|nr:hypothetical protein [Paraburkholderia sp.]HKR47011.1 hypothetical protein [Paraburkholderia sp.]